MLIPTGTWHSDPHVKQVGSLVSRGWALAWKQLEPLLIEDGLTPERANEIATSALEELQHTEIPIVVKYHIVYGIKG